mgnify:CR=1 FL=1
MRFVFAFIVVFAAVGVLIYFAVQDTAKAVVTVAELSSAKSLYGNVRLGARVSGEDISYNTAPYREVRFHVRDPRGGAETIEVVYHGAMPDTLRVGRDVILEGRFDGSVFHASSLMTQCPSKYEPPVPPESSVL